MKVIVVDINDEPISTKDIYAMSKSDIYRCAALWLTNSQGQILMAQRHLGKRHDPGKWSNAVSGTVEEGETYETNIYKEAEEEIGLTDVNFIKGPKVLNDSNYIFFVQWFSAVVDWPIEQFTVQKSEVEQIAWIDKEYLVNDLRANPDKYVSGASKVFEGFLG